MKEIEVVQQLQIRGLHVFLNTLEYRTPHLHKELELIWVLDGRMELHIAQGKFFADPGDLLILNSKQIHSLHQIGRLCTFLGVQISPQFFAYSFPAISGLRFDEPILPRSTHSLAPLLESLALSYMRQENGYELFCAGQAHLLLHHLLQTVPHHVLSEAEALEQNSRGERLNRLIDFVERNHQSKITLSDFAKQEKRSMSYLSHFVKENLGQSFQDYVTAVRFQTACSLIVTGRERLLDVCVESGFSDYRYFSNTFRQRVGLTPGEYREKHAADGACTSSTGNWPPPHTQAAHSLERLYSREESIRLFTQFRQTQQNSIVVSMSRKQAIAKRAVKTIQQPTKCQKVK